MEEEFKKIESSFGWERHFMTISEKSRMHKSEIGESPENHALNRYLDVVPFDHTRVKLNRLEGNDYINANIVSVPKATCQYILTQGPLPETVGHFWLMVWEQKSNVIVMLNRVVEMEHFVKCEPYWPEKIGYTDTYDDVNLLVTLDSVQEKKHYSIRNMTIKDLESKKTRKVTQFSYTAWPDHGSPDSPTSFLRLLSAIRKSGGLDKMDEPAVIHCSAGIGRSGTFCLIDSILCMIENQGSTEDIDIVNTLIEMRDYRKGLIQSYVQLRFAYLSIIYGIKILERANKLHHHISSTKGNTTNDNPSKSTREPEGALKKSRKGKRKTSKGLGASSTLNVFKQHLLVDALDEIDSDTADSLFYDMMMPWPSLKKRRNDDFSDDEGLSSRPPKLNLDRMKLCDSPPLRSPSEIESSLLKRREKNQRIAEKTLEIKARMRQEGEKRERHIWRMNFLKKSAIYGSVAALVLSSLYYSYMKFHGP